MNSPFKIGDKVRITKRNGAPSRYVGQIGYITEVVAAEANPYVVQFESDYWYYNDASCELVENELEALVRKANEGAEASRQLRIKFKDQVEEKWDKYNGEAWQRLPDYGSDPCQRREG